MSKSDMARGMSMDSGRERERERQIPGREPSEDEVLEMRLNLLQQHDMQKLKNSVELMKALKDLHGLIKDASLSVRQSANEVRVYPAEVVTQATARVEQSVRQCVEASERARDTYNEATRLVGMVEKHIVWWVVLASVLSPTVIATILLWLMPR